MGIAVVDILQINTAGTGALIHKGTEELDCFDALFANGVVRLVFHIELFEEILILKKGIVKTEDFEEIAELAVRALDSLLSYQNYPILAAENGSIKRRTLGIGVINYAYYLAKNGVRYSDGSANALTHKTFEAMQYYLLKASCKLAKEFGACPGF